MIAVRRRRPMRRNGARRGAASSFDALASRLALGQGAYYVLTGVWPLLSMRTFEAVTGPKVDRWLVKTVGALVTVMGGALLLAGRRGHISEEVLLVGAGSAVGLTGIDLGSSLSGRISKVYLLDALAEMLLLLGWGLALACRRHRSCPAGHSARRPFSTKAAARYLP